MVSRKNALDRGPLTHQLKLALSHYKEQLSPSPNVFREIKKFQRRLGRPILIWDIGANSGDWARRAKFALGKSMNAVLFEANPIHVDSLTGLGWPVYIELLHSSDGCIVPFFSVDGTGDSIYKENSIHYSHPRVLEFTTSTVSTLARLHSLQTPDFVKIDTQGSELNILSGFGTLLNSVKWIYLELPISNWNQGAPGLTETVNFLEEQGFQPTEVCEVHKSENRILQIDVLFQYSNLQLRG